MEEKMEKCIGKIVQKIFPIEWMRVDMYSSQNIYKTIPMLVFRVKENSSVDLIEKLETCIYNFQGRMSWKLFKDPLSRNGNYLLTIVELQKLHMQCYESQIEYNQKKYFGIEKFKLYCEYAIEDIPLLAEYIEKNML